MASTAMKYVPMKTMGFMAVRTPDLPEPPAAAGQSPEASRRRQPKEQSGQLHGHERPLTPAEVAEFLRITPACARKWAREGKLPSVKIGTKVWIPADEFFRLMQTERAAMTQP